MLITGLVFAALAALLHVYIFVMESITWTSARTRATFGATAEEATATKAMAFNQGFYNLFLAITVGIGIALLAVGSTSAGLAMVLTGTASMTAAGVVLLAYDRTKASAAMKQLAFPLIAVILTTVSLVS